MALDVDVIADALFAGTKTLLERKLAPILAANALLTEENEKLSQRLAAVECREIPVFDPSGIKADIDAIWGSVSKMHEGVDDKIETRIHGVTRTLEDGLASIPKPDVEGSIAAATAPLLERLQSVERSLGTLPTTDAIEAAVAPLREAVEAVKAVEVPDVAALVEAEVAKLPVPQNGKDAELPDIAAMVAEEVAKIPAPQDGKDAELPDIAAMVAEEVAKIPPAPAGKDAELPDIEAIVAAEVAKIPPPQNGIDGKDAELPDIGAIVAAEVAKIPAPQNGKDAILPDIPAIVDDAVAAGLENIRKQVPQLAAPTFRLNEDGELIAKNQNGETFNVGKVRGNDGLGLDDIEIDYDGERRISFKMRGADRETEPRTFVLPISIYRGVWQQDQKYEKGDNVTWAGSIWVAQTDTTAKPETNADWKLAVKRGRDGKDRMVPPAPQRGGR